MHPWPASGRVDVYTGAALTVASNNDIDHRVPLRAAWEVDSWARTDARRCAYANSLEDGREVRATELDHIRPHPTALHGAPLPH